LSPIPARGVRCGTRLEKPCGRLEAVDIVLLSSGRGHGVILVRQETRKPDEKA